MAAGTGLVPLLLAEVVWGVWLTTFDGTGMGILRTAMQLVLLLRPSTWLPGQACPTARQGPGALQELLSRGARSQDRTVPVCHTRV